MDEGGITTDRTFALAEAVGSPHERLTVVHIAGTSGKTTTCYYVAALLAQAGKKVGLTVSPHIASVRERVQIGGEPLGEMQFVAYFREFMNIVEQSGLEPTYFEMMMVFALWVFEREGVDYAVVETGMGGMHDSSNICRSENKLCVITDIGFDHTHILGNTLGEIAAQKAGIIASRNLVCMYEQVGDVMQPVYVAVNRSTADLRIAPASDATTYQERNFGLAQFVYRQISLRDHLSELDAAQIDVARTTHVPGRLEKIRVGDSTFLLDGAHNEQKMSMLISTLNTIYPAKKWPIVLVMKADKDTSAITSQLANIAAEVVASEFRSGQDLPAKSTPARELAELFRGANLNVAARPRLEDALEYYLEKHTDLVLVTGSFYAVAEARAWLLGQKQGIVER